MTDQTTLSTLERCAEILRRNHFDVVLQPDLAAAGQYLRDEIQRLTPKSISFGDSMTLLATGLIDDLRAGKYPDITFYDGFVAGNPDGKNMERRRQGLLSDLFLTGINAISLEGSLHWLDMIGNRIAPVAFGPKKVILLAGRNKICPTPADAEARIREIAAPKNAARHEGFTTPCIKTGRCMDCRSPQRICNEHLILSRCYPAGRITVVLIDQEAGL